MKNDQTGSTIFIDAYIHDTGVLIEQKGMDIDLSKSYRQSDGSMLTPFQQARRYAGLLPHNMNPRWIEINDFAVTVARTALWIAESQMMRETEDIVHMQLDFLPLKTAANAGRKRYEEG